MNKSKLDIMYWTPIGLYHILRYEKFSTDKTTSWYGSVGLVHGLYGVIAMYLISLFLK